ncbi:MAG: helicase-exonuclease AddAB subunit AddA [Paenibacillaceae bacterium]|nr:helicase-exonuclease AddAB subunit AddA [Paenibacillaceae bacterium]
MTRTWTPAQRQAIETTGTNILVAASAGSGKTAVLIERIVEHVCRGVPIERLLVVTFTAAAAEEMRHRLRHALTARAAQGYHVQDEITRLPLAHVMTVHAFCQHVVRTYPAEAGIDPSVRLAQATEQMLLRQDAREAVLEHHYKTMPTDDPFWQFVLHYGGQTSDEAIVDVMEQLYHLAWSQPFPEQWLAQLSVHHGMDYMRPLERMALAKMHDWQQRLLDLQERATAQLAPLRVTIEADRAIVQSWIDALLQGWVPFTKQLCAPQFTRAKPIKDVSDPEAKKAWSKERDAIKNDMKSLWKRVRVCTDTDHDPTAVWIRLVRAYHQEYTARKKTKKLMDFQDLEHVCLRVLGTPSEPSAIATELQAQYVEVMVDEYQDTNAVQESILQCVSQKNNRFMVGDVKQSIYRFRLAQPELFMEKATTYGAQDGIRIDLTDNFRSRDAVISFVNAIFSTMMDRQFAEIPYDTAAKMTASASYPALDPHCTVPELVLLDRGAHEEDVAQADGASDPEHDASDEEGEQRDHVHIEAQWIAHRIAQAMCGAQPFFVSERSEVRTAHYRDIAILVRNNSWIPHMLDALHAWGIPAHGEVRQGFFASTEGRTMLALLQAIDNPYQDIPLVALLRSPIGQFSDDDLVWVRMQQEGPIFDALRAIATTTSPLAERVRTWLHRFELWRLCARQQSVATLLRTVLRASAYDVYVGGLQDGARRQANIQSLIDRARQHEHAAMPGLFSFLRMLEQLQQQGQDVPSAVSVGEQEDVVRVMTVHKSKGLEFPIVIVAGMGVQFSNQDARQPLLLHKTALAAQTVDMDNATIMPTMRWWALQTLKKQEQWAEELRVLYVALTRAREKLVLCGSSPHAETMWSKWQRHAQTPQMTAGQFWDARTWLDWIVPACLRCPHTDPPLWTRTSVAVPPRPSPQVTPNYTFIAPQPQDDGLEQAITTRHTFVHPYYPLQHIAAKRAVSDVLALEHGEKPTETAVTQRRWRTMRNPIDRPLSAGERGRAIHAVMEFIPLHEPPTLQRLRTWIAHWIQLERLTQQQADAVPLEAIIQFWHQPIGQRIRQSTQVYRELPFSLMVPLSRWHPEVPQEHVLVQGVIDCLCKTDTGWMLVDYKTESTRHKTDDALRQKFMPQIQLYTEGVETALHDRVEEQVLYFFDGNRTVTIPR